ncbi:thiamine pyrophosphate-dependent enzyme [Acinetobacter sp. ME22]|uniref:thiamine pyrophosphate-dependent enzyme n=1 Tax=Acinetobacter sp. ME22 TaxID=2904802 RepID=UPI001EDA2592|nr:thiamine pyrophosphate-dependent enzyme [Acinetobacter sp. ME22]MCG2571997.1 thiamine pyrophosphate-dependent enzyme [Acinetobacter sp. ME22]
MNIESPQVAVMTGGDALVQGLKTHGVDTVFALPGAQIYGFTDALARNTDSIRVVGARHEQTSAYMAFGYARSTGKAGVFSVVPGPGILNASAAMLTAHGCNAPVLAITGDVMSSFKDRGRGQLHELPRQLEILQGIGKWAAHIEQPADTSWKVARAFQEMSSGRQGVVSLQASWDFFTRQGAVQHQAALPLQPNPPVDLDKIDDAAQLLKNAKSPMIFVGSGALDASTEVQQLAEVLGAPVVSFRGGRGVVADDHPLGFTVASGAKLWAQTDVAIVIGSRFELLDIRWRHRPAGLKLIRIDIDPTEVRRIDANVSIIADAAEAAQALTESVLRTGVPKHRTDEIAAVKATAEEDIQSIQPQLSYLKVIREVLPRDGFFIEEISQVGFTSIFGFPVYKPRTLVTSGHQGTLGFGFPTALGVKVANPDKAVISICGDGGFLFAAQELATAVQYGINLVTVVFNNNAYGNVYRDQQETFAGRLLGSELVNPDFVKFAESFGVQAMRVSSPVQLKTALEQAFAADRPVLVEVTVPRGSDSSPWKFLHPNF